MGGRRGRLISPEDRVETVKFIEESCKSGARLAPACKILEISIRTFERWKKPFGQKDLRKMSLKKVANKLTIEEKEKVLFVSNSTEFRDLPPCKIVPLLANDGEYIASESTFYRILKEKNQLAHRGKTKPAKHNRPRECIAYKPNQVWSWDITYLPTTVVGKFFYLYMIMDVFSRKIVGFRVHTEELAEHASHLIKQACFDEKIQQNQLTLHQDNGSPMKSSLFHATLQKLGVIPSFSRPSVSDDNPYSESLFKTMKYRPEYPADKKFSAPEEANKWSEWFVSWYNNQHLHSDLKFVTPAQRHDGKDKAILSSRHNTYLLARQKNPLRWSGRKTRNWNLPDSVTLNPNKKHSPAIEKTGATVMIAA